MRISAVQCPPRYRKYAYVLIGILISAFSLYADSGVHDRDLADAYVSTFLHDTIDVADYHLLEVALEFYPSHGDALYLLGRHPAVPKKAAIEYLENALLAEYWSIYNVNDAGIELFKLYCQMKRYSTADVLLNGYSLDFFKSPEDAKLLAQYYDAVNEEEKFKEVVEKGYSKWYSHFVRYKIQIDDEFRSLLLDRINRFNDFSPGKEALEALFEYEKENEVSSTDILKRYIDTGEFSPVLHCYCIKKELLGPEELNKVLSFGTEVSSILNYGLEDPLISETLDIEYSTFNGHINFDWNNDGFPEEYLDFQNGEMVSQHIDKDQDGINDINISFNTDGSPDRIIYYQDDTSWAVQYVQYPYVSEVKKQDNFDIVYRFDQAAFQIINISQKQYIPYEIIDLSSENLDKFCLSYSVEKDSIAQNKETDDNASVFSLDVNENGIQEYILTIRGSVKEEQWDIDEDGNADIHQIIDSASDKKILTLFGYTITLIKGRPVSLLYEGMEKDIIIDGSYVWIDSTPVDLSGITLVDGYFSYNGKTYYGYSFQDYTYIQAIGN